MENGNLLTFLRSSRDDYAGLACPSNIQRSALSERQLVQFMKMVATGMAHIAGLNVSIKMKLHKSQAKSKRFDADHILESEPWNGFPVILLVRQILFNTFSMRTYLPLNFKYNNDVIIIVQLLYRATSSSM